MDINKVLADFFEKSEDEVKERLSHLSLFQYSELIDAMDEESKEIENDEMVIRLWREAEEAQQKGKKELEEDQDFIVEDENDVIDFFKKELKKVNDYDEALTRTADFFGMRGEEVDELINAEKPVTEKELVETFKKESKLDSKFNINKFVFEFAKNTNMTKNKIISVLVENNLINVVPLMNENKETIKEEIGSEIDLPTFVVNKMVMKLKQLGDLRQLSDAMFTNLAHDYNMSEEDTNKILSIYKDYVAAAQNVIDQYLKSKNQGYQPDMYWREFVLDAVDRYNVNPGLLFKISNVLKDIVVKETELIKTYGNDFDKKIDQTLEAINDIMEGREPNANILNELSGLEYRQVLCRSSQMIQDYLNQINDMGIDDLMKLHANAHGYSTVSLVEHKKTYSQLKEFAIRYKLKQLAEAKKKKKKEEDEEELLFAYDNIEYDNIKSYDDPSEVKITEGVQNIKESIIKNSKKK